MCVRLFVCLCYDGKQIEITQFTYSVVVEERKREREKEYTILLPCL